MSACFERGHFDGYRPTFRIVLHQQAAPFVQQRLFAGGRAEIVSPAPPCTHPATEPQRRITDRLIIDDVCVKCGSLVDDEEIGGGL